MSWNFLWWILKIVPGVKFTLKLTLCLRKIIQIFFKSLLKWNLLILISFVASQQASIFRDYDNGAYHLHWLPDGWGDGRFQPKFSGSKSPSNSHNMKEEAKEDFKNPKFRTINLFGISFSWPFQSSSQKKYLKNLVKLVVSFKSSYIYCIGFQIIPKPIVSLK